MKQISFCLLTALLCALGLSAYGQLSLGGNLNVNLPQGDFGDEFKTGYGATATVRYGLNERINIGLNLGIQAFNGKANHLFYEDASVRFVPITGVFEFNLLTGKLKPYLGADLGLYNYKVKYKGGSVGTYEKSETDLGMAPTFGLNFGMADNLDLNFNIKYHVVFNEGTNATFIGLGAGLIYYLGDKR